MDPGTFLKTLWGDTPPGQAHIWINPSNTSLWYSRFDRVNHDLQAHADGNIYTGVALAPTGSRHPKQRVLASDTTAVAGLWADIDYGSTGHKKTNLPPTFDDAIELLDSLRFAPTIVVNSGHGIQPWWLFTAPWAFANPTDRALAQRLSRWWHHHIAEILAQHGWALDATHDLARVLRVPGTTNHKGDPVPVTIITADGPRRDRHEFIDLIPQDFQPTPAETPGPQRAADGAPHQSPGTLLLNPNAEPPSIKLTTLLQFNKKFNQSWQGTRTDLLDDSASSYDLSMATIALDNGWTEQETVDLIIAWRRSKGKDLKLRQTYYRTTIDKAKQPLEVRRAYHKLDEQLDNLGQDKPQPDEPSPPPPKPRKSSSSKSQPPPPDHGGDAEIIETLTVIIGITIIKITKFAGDPPSYWMSTTEGDITLGTVDNLISQTKFRNAVAAATGRLIPTYRQEQWRKIGQTLLRACQEVNLGEASHPVPETNSWLENYLTDQTPIDDRDHAATTRRPFNGPDCVYIYADSFRLYIENQFNTKITSQDIRKRLTMCGATPETVNVQVGPKRTSRYCWKIPNPWPPDSQ